MCHAGPRLLLVLLAAAPLRGQDAVVLDPVEVTAAPSRPEVERLIEQPTPITSYDGTLLGDVGATSYDELAPLVPGFFASPQSVENISLNLRGLTTDAADPRISTRVPVFQDGVIISSPRGGGTALFDVATVDVLKGPQPAAFGRGVQNGALSITSNRARNETSGALTAGFGDFGTRLANGYYNVPIIDDTFFARAAFFFERNDGYVDNDFPGADALQGRDTFAFRTSLRWQPAPDTTADLIVDVQRDTPPGVAFKSLVIPTSTGDTDPFADAEQNRGDALGIDRTLVGVAGMVNHRLNEIWEVTSTSAFRDVDSNNEFDADGSRFYLFELGEHTYSRQFSQELRFNYDAGGRFTGMVGAGLLGEKGRQGVTLRTNENALFTLLAGVPPPVPLRDYYEESHTNRSEIFAGDLFGRGDYKLTEKLTLGASLRLTREKITSGYQSFASPTPGNFGVLFPSPFPGTGGGNNIFRPTPGRLETSETYNSWSGRVDARYAFTPRHQAYASVGRGRRPPVLTFSQVTFAREELAEERVWNYEAGFKGASATRRLRYDVSVFQYYYDSFQTERVVGPGSTAPFDGGRARGQGFEATLQGDVAENLTLFATYGFTDAKFASRSADGEPQAFAGDRFRLTAEHAFSVGGTLTLPAGDRGTLFITPVAQYRSEQFFEDDNDAFGGRLRQGGFTLLNLRVGYRPRGARWEVVGYVDNLLDKDYLIDAGNVGLAYGFPTAIRGAPRMMGVQATVRF